jgi:hypothetical protein
MTNNQVVAQLRTQIQDIDRTLTALTDSAPVFPKPLQKMSIAEIDYVGSDGAGTCKMIGCLSWLIRQEPRIAAQILMREFFTEKTT